MRYSVRVWDKREHWYFDVVVEAQDSRHAIIVARQIYAQRHYTIVSAVRG